MKARFCRAFVLIPLAINLLVPSAQAFEIGAVAGADFGKESISYPRETPDYANQSASASYVFGPVFRQDILFSELFVEADVLVVGRKYNYAENSSDIMELKQVFLQAPLLIKYQFPPGIFVGVGGYYQRGLGSISSSESLGGGTPHEKDREYGVFRKRDDLGWVASLGLSLPVDSSLSLIADFRYLHGLKNSLVEPNYGYGAYNRMFHLLAGLSFAI